MKINIINKVTELFFFISFYLQKAFKFLHTCAGHQGPGYVFFLKNKMWSCFNSAVILLCSLGPKCK